MKHISAHRKVQEKVLNTLCLAIGIIAVPVLSFSLYRAIDTGWLSLFNYQIIATLMVIGVAIFRKSLSYNLKTSVSIAIALALALSSAAVFWGRKQAMV